MPAHTHLTPSAERSLSRATQFAIADGTDRVTASHMLWALWLEESNASAVLQSLGVQRKQVELAVNATEPGDEPHDASLTTDVIIEARQFLSRVDTQAGELTSEHLLLGLTNLAPKQLSQLGVTAQRIEDLLVPAEDTTSLPVGDEFQLGGGEPESPAPSASEVPLPEARTIAGTSPLLSRDLNIYRTIDAAANRAREGLRVVEDLVRFSLGDRFLTEQLKSLRHDLSSALSALDPIQLIRARDTQRDTGTTITVPTERRRENQFQILLANMKRCQEAMRTLEEMTKAVTSPACETVSARVEQARYRSYTIEKAIATTIKANELFADRCLYLLVTESICAGDWQDVVMEAIEGGVDVIQLREKALPDAEIVRRGRWLRARTAAADVIFIVNDRPDIAAEVEADGVHVGQEEFTVQESRRIVGPSALVGVSTHGIDQAHRAVLDGADYLGVGPVFPTKTKSFEDYAGLDFVKEIAKEITLPWFAIGGISKTNLDQIRSAGGRRVAVSSAICGTQRVRQDSKMMAEGVRD